MLATNSSNVEMRDPATATLRDRGIWSLRRNNVKRASWKIPFMPGGLNRSTQHFILEGKDGVWDGTKIS
jgi:hypothetical protein